VTATFVIVCVSVGLGTYLFRYLPARLRGGERWGAARGPLGRYLGAFLGSVGVAAVAALLAASLAPYLPVTLAGGLGGGASRDALAALAGLAATAAAFRWRRDVAVSTLVGAVAFGVAWWLA